VKITFAFPGRTRTPKPKLRKKTGGTARAQLAARDPNRGVTVLGSSLPFMTRRSYRTAKRVWPG
jgi:hypothetical protein